MLLRSRADDQQKKLEAERVLVAVGVQPNSEHLGLEELGAELDRHGSIKVDEHYRTAVRGLYAIGDVIGGMALAHVASAEAVHVAEIIAGHPAVPVPYDSIPTCTYCHPEIASVGLTEEEATAAEIPVRPACFPSARWAKRSPPESTPGFAKFLWDQRDGSLVGAHLIGPAVTDLIAEPTLAKSTEVNAESLIATVHAHPTFAEALKEATEQALGRAIHI